MGKAKKIKVSKGDKNLPKVGLADQIEEDKTVKTKSRKKVRIRNDGDEEVRMKFILFIYVCYIFLSKIPYLKVVLLQY